MTLTGSSNGHDKDAMKWLKLTRKMAGRLGLEDDDVDSAPHVSESEPVSDDIRSRAHVAWGYFIATW